MDSIDIYREHYATNRAGDIFTIVQKSIRFAKMKKLAVYAEHDYLGTYEVVDFYTFRVKNLTNMVSLLVFGEHERYGRETLRKFRIRGRMSDNTEMYFVCFRFIEYEPKFKINRVTYEQSTEQTNEALRDESGKEVSDAGPGDVDVAPF